MDKCLRCTACITHCGKRVSGPIVFFWLTLLCLPLLAAAQPAQNPAEVFQRLNADYWVAQEVTLRDLGFTEPLVITAPDNARELYFPVPANAPLSRGEIRLNASYLRADGGPTSMLVSLDTYPVSVRSFAAEKGNASLLLGVDGAPRSSGFVRLGLNWGPPPGTDPRCAGTCGSGSPLRIETDSKFSYRYDSSAVRDANTAWGALPPVPVILISAKNLGSEAYDSAWRLGVALERAGKRSKIVVLPAVGDVVDLAKVTISPALRAVPAFAALAQGGSFKLKNAAEVGAWMSLGANGSFRGDIIIADKAMSASMGAAFDALRIQLQAAAPDAVTAYTAWRADSLDFSARPPASKEILMTRVAGRPAIVVAADAGANAAGLFSAQWSGFASASSIVVQAAGQPSTGKPVVPAGHMLLEKSKPSGDFIGMVAAYERGAHVMVPAGYLTDAFATLPRVIRVAASTGVLPQNARFTAVRGDAAPPAGGAFLAMELPLRDTHSKVTLDGGHVVIRGAGDKRFLDVTGHKQIGIVEVVKLGADMGVTYRDAGAQPPAMDKSLLLSQGDVAIIGLNGLLGEINTADSIRRAVLEGTRRPWMLSIGYGWTVPLLAVIFVIGSMVFASRIRRRTAGKTVL